MFQQAGSVQVAKLGQHLTSEIEAERGRAALLLGQVRFNRSAKVHSDVESR